MLKRITGTLFVLLTAFPLFAQDATTATDIERRLRELEQRVAAMQAAQPSADLVEVKRQIEVLAAEVEALKTRQTETVATADTQQYGLGAAASKVYRAGEGLSFGGYGEFLYQNVEGAGVDRADFLRAILYTGYKFNDRVIFNSEVEYEHANTERNGEVEVEFGYLDFMVRPEMNVRAGLVLMPVGLLNEQHEPTSFLSSRRNTVESRILPTTWSELGAGVFGDVGPVTYRAYVTTALDSAAFTATGIRGGRQMGSNAKANDLAAVARADWHPMEGTLVGGSIYSGNSAQERNTYEGRVTLAEAHADAKLRGLQLRALVARGSVGDAAAINARNALTGTASVGKSFGGWYVEGGYDILTHFARRDMSLTPYARYEKLDTQRSVPTGFLRNRANNQTITTIGFAFKPISQTVVKVDYQNVDNEAGTGINQWNVALGYIF
ncbi:MAG TPA: hypothetical protein VFN10_12900 [Thermoanaerobaculia bacterium]|nr:hypothetical protein [Thermoanaerobaculia bacterium]